MSSVRLVFRSSAATTGTDRLVIEGRSGESSGLALCVSRVAPLDENGRAGPGYEPDLLLTPEWKRRTVLLSDLDAGMPDELGGAELSPWAPHEVSRCFPLHFRRCELLAPAYVAVALRLPRGLKQAHRRAVA